MDYKKNAVLLEDAVKNRSFIRHISRHRKPDGALDIEGNLKQWNNAIEAFAKIKLWDETPDFNLENTLQSEPYIVFIPAKAELSRAGRSTIIIAHGGGFSWRTGCEAVNVAYYFHQAGFSTAILNYRIQPYSRLDAIADMQRAIRLLRSKRTELGISGKITVMGFSAGGMLSANCATHFDYGTENSDDPIESYSCRPDAAVIGYGAISSVSFPKPFGMKQDSPMMGRDKAERYYLAPEKNIKTDSPPFFIWQTLSDDGRQGMILAQALSDAEVPYDLHIFQPGEHGLAMADGENDLGMKVPHTARWGELCCSWLELNGL